jgi:hypothetical protein
MTSLFFKCRAAQPVMYNIGSSSALSPPPHSFMDIGFIWTIPTHTVLCRDARWYFLPLYAIYIGPSLELAVKKKLVGGGHEGELVAAALM